MEDRRIPGGRGTLLKKASSARLSSVFMPVEKLFLVCAWRGSRHSLVHRSGFPSLFLLLFPLICHLTSSALSRRLSLIVLKPVSAPRRGKSFKTRWWMSGLSRMALKPAERVERYSGKGKPCDRSVRRLCFSEGRLACRAQTLGRRSTY